MNSSLFMHPPYWDEPDLMVLRKNGYPGDASLVKSRRRNDERRPAVLFVMPVSMPNRPDWPEFTRISEPAEKFTESQVALHSGSLLALSRNPSTRPKVGCAEDCTA
jgi:hypothetical protein